MKPLVFGSVCSGIEAASVAWAPLGWRARWFAEVEPHASRVLAHHYPGTPNHGDFRKIGREHGRIDLLCGGTPCQSFSYAGERGGIEDPRGNLTREFCALADRLRPRWLLWENVPGVLTADSGRAFGSFVGALAELGYGFAWRVLDAQHFGVPQRRRRLFLVAHSGARWDRAAEVLFERDGSGRDPAPLGDARQDAAARADARAARGGPLAFHLTQDPISGTVTPTLSAGGSHGCATLGVLVDGVARKLMPIECERLQGFPDDYTAPLGSDAPRFKVLGNSMAVPVMRWIGERIAAVEQERTRGRKA